MSFDSGVKLLFRILGFGTRLVCFELFVDELPSDRIKLLSVRPDLSVRPVEDIDRSDEPGLPGEAASDNPLFDFEWVECSLIVL